MFYFGIFQRFYENFENPQKAVKASRTTKYSRCRYIRWENNKLEITDYSYPKLVYSLHPSVLGLE
ncbi:uncharacterized protein CANTADRAFT_25082 [Suhomyces tanzawaensis NRRL Y-17324]|uniref:Uncharacterized protein n=1 Tax=Suhomyces tanzawaensis NRRL Y-17324 TaxID=984487 RepID=A0A1E4SMA4_9ASCO|nr:uncharacterized protein CANTADRAFT_25082 [Suhomyces tanzawaensis NRRL Y-17324]ODV80618.1 hypothetical protein CANTADRAFT_25082 [Suhomyces tanzawaensis NRRL Y-17324]